ncbi:MAG TPA: hypothetical protein VLK82_01250 [Candidatus Tectomicrobia bacterium]|nr:hypothetical protein [Candidatus Tectomicrobia bacterium]
MAKRMGMLLALAALIVGSTAPAYAWRGHRGYGYYGYRRPSVVIVPRIVVPFGVPYVYPPAVVAAPPVYVQPAPQVYVQPPPPQPYWYYCDDPQGYYPYVPQCPGGWRQVTPTPPR